MRRIGVLTSGGDSPGMNAAIRAVARTAAHHDIRCMGIMRGYQGLIDDNLRELGPRDVSGIIDRGGTILKSARCKPFYEAEGRATAAACLKRHEIDALVVIGGDGSYRGAAALEAEHGVRVMGLPGTIDNDIGGTHFTIGFDTAMNTAMQAIDKVRDTAASHERIFFVEVMGRHSGYIAMIAGMAGGAEEILTPEEPSDIPMLVDRLRSEHESGKQSMIVVVAEGDDAGNAFEIAKQVENASEFKNLRVTVLGHLQRGGSPTALDRVLASRMGVRAVEALLQGDHGLMVGVEGPELVLRPFAYAWDNPSTFDPELFRVARVLSS